jgi:formiminotetrahydrofolate cyclodeaminase
MPAGTDLSHLGLRDFSDRIAERTPTPGGGSVAAYLLSMGAALTAMAFRFTSGPKFAAVEAALQEKVASLEAARSRALDLVELDSAAYDKVSAAYVLPKSSDAEKAARTRAIQEGIRGALEVPLETLRAAVDALRLAASGAPDVNKNLASDCATGSWCLWSAAEAAALNVRINAASLADAELGRARLAECESLRKEAESLAASARTSAARHLA